MQPDLGSLFDSPALTQIDQSINRLPQSKSEERLKTNKGKTKPQGATAAGHPQAPESQLPHQLGINCCTILLLLLLILLLLFLFLLLLLLLQLTFVASLSFFIFLER